MKFNTVLFTGTFDPIHIGHINALQKAHKFYGFNKVTILVSIHDPNKPHATNFNHRLNMVNLMINESNLPFKVKIDSIENVLPENLNVYLEQPNKNNKILRIVGSDNLINYINNDKFHPVLKIFHFAVIVRPIVPLGKFVESTNKLLIHLRTDLNYDIVNVQSQNLEAKTIRSNLYSIKSSLMLSKNELNYIKNNKLYSLK